MITVAYRHFREGNRMNLPDRERPRMIFEHLKAIAEEKHWELTAVQEASALNDPFRVLMAGMLSARTREEDTRAATNKLFELASTPQAMATLSEGQVAMAISAVTFAENKVGYVQEIARRISENDGYVPRTMDELTALPGVGWKTAVLTLWMAFGIAEEICVDVHVARIGQRLGFVNPTTTNPQKVSQELMAILPQEIWGPWNPLMVRFGRTTCYPSRPACPRCPVLKLCPQIGIRR